MYTKGITFTSCLLLRWMIYLQLLSRWKRTLRTNSLSSLCRTVMMHLEGYWRKKWSRCPLIPRVLSAIFPFVHCIVIVAGAASWQSYSSSKGRVRHERKSKKDREKQQRPRCLSVSLKPTGNRKDLNRIIVKQHWETANKISEKKDSLAPDFVSGGDLFYIDLKTGERKEKRCRLYFYNWMKVRKSEGWLWVSKRKEVQEKEKRPRETFTRIFFFKVSQGNRGRGKWRGNEVEDQLRALHSKSSDEEKVSKGRKTRRKCHERSPYCTSRDERHRLRSLHRDNSSFFVKYQTIVFFGFCHSFLSSPLKTYCLLTRNETRNTLSLFLQTQKTWKGWREKISGESKIRRKEAGSILRINVRGLTLTVDSPPVSCLDCSKNW